MTRAAPADPQVAVLAPGRPTAGERRRAPAPGTRDPADLARGMLAALALTCACGGDHRGTGADAGGGDGDADGDGQTVAPPSCAIDLTPWLESLRVPGVAAAILKDGAIACTAVAGLADIESDRPVAPDTIFWWASVSKPVSATAALSAWQDGAFALEDEVNGALPFAVVHPDPACAGAPITFFQLLVHASSIFENEALPAYTDGFVVGEPRRPLGEYLADYLVPGGATYRPQNFIAACPGVEYQYSSIAYGLLGFAVESLVGRPFDRFCKERIFDPLGLADTSFTVADLDPGKLATPYARELGVFVPLGPREHANYPDGSLRSSVLDLARFTLMTMAGGALDGVRVLEAATIAEMLRPQAPEIDDTQGFGWYHDEYAGRDVIGHDGWDPGATSFLYFDPADGAAVLLVANGEWREALAEQLLDQLFAEAATY